MLKVGHRGSPGVTPENTLTSFRKAMKQGADGIELDVHLCKSGELVVMHDDTVDRTTNGTGRVAEMTWEELQLLRIAGGEHMSTLEEILKKLGPKTYYFVEIKHKNAARPVAKLLEQYAGKGWKRLMLISFHHDALAVARKIVPSLIVGASFETLTLKGLKKAHKLGAKAVLPFYLRLRRVHMQHANALGIKVITWTVNDRMEIARMRSLKVDGIISDYPDRLALHA